MNRIIIILMCLLPIMGKAQTFGEIRAKSNAGTSGPIYRTLDALKVADSAALVQLTKAADSAYHRVMFKISQLPIVSLDSNTTRNTMKVLNTVAVSGTFWQATQPVSLASVPSHAVTNAGTFAVQSTNQANSGVDIGDVTINNASGGGAVNIQDGGNSITVDASSLPLPTGAATETTLSSVDETATNIYANTTSIAGAVAARNASVPQNVVQVGGSDGAKLRPIKIDTAGVVYVTGSFSATPGTTVIYDSTVTATSMTVTNLNSVANSATVGWQSIRVSNVSAKASDYKISVKLTMANTAPANDKAVYVYVCPHYTTDGGSTWLAASQGTTTLPTGSEGATTIASPNNLRLLGVLSYTTQNMVLQDNFLISNAFGNVMPDGFQIIIIDYSGAAISASGNSVHYSPIYKTQR